MTVISDYGTCESGISEKANILSNIMYEMVVMSKIQFWNSSDIVASSIGICIRAII